MSRTSTRVRASVVGAVLAVSVAACGSPDPSTAAPDSGPDLLQALPAPSSAPVSVLTAPPTTTASPTTPRTTTPRPSPKPGATSAAPKKAAPAAAPAPAAKKAAKPAPASGPGPEWRPVGGDEFNGSGLDASSWKPYDSKGGFGTGLRKPEAISQSGGTMRITARADVSGGMRHEFGQLYGRWEFRARTDPGRGFGSAILLWPDSEKWPQDGELDIMEVPGENRDLAHFVTHWAEGGADKVHGTSVPGNFANWHTFALEWLPDRITWYVDGVKSYENTDRTAIPTTSMHMTIQLDQGPKANWIDARDGTTPEELALEVDWVRIYAQ